MVAVRIFEVVAVSCEGRERFQLCSDLDSTALSQLYSILLSSSQLWVAALFYSVFFRRFVLRSFIIFGFLPHALRFAASDLQGVGPTLASSFVLES